MNLDTVIDHMRRNQDNTFKLIAGAAEFSALVKDGNYEVNPPLPALYVIPLSSEATPNTNQNFLRQLVSEQIACIIMVDNTLDRRGQTGVSNIELLKYKVHSLLLYFRPPELLSRTKQGMAFVGEELINRNFNRLEWQMRYVLDVFITHEDGWHIPSIPLKSVTIVDTNKPGNVHNPFDNKDELGQTVIFPQD